MKHSTEIWAKFESKGYPEKTEKFHGTARDAALRFGLWLLSPGVYLTTTITMRIAKTESELDEASSRGSQSTAEYEQLFNSLLDGAELGDDHEPS